MLDLMLPLKPVILIIILILKLENTSKTLTLAKLLILIHVKMGFLIQFIVFLATIAIIVIALIVVNVLLIYCYRRYTRREMKEEMQLQINSAVTQYFALSESQKDRRPLVG